MKSLCKWGTDSDHLWYHIPRSLYFLLHQGTYKEFLIWFSTGGKFQPIPSNHVKFNNHLFTTQPQLYHLHVNYRLRRLLGICFFFLMLYLCRLSGSQPYLRPNSI